MTALAEKMKSAGVDTIGSRLTANACDAIRNDADESVVNIWNAVGRSFGYEFIRGLMADMKQDRVPPASPVNAVATSYREQSQASVSSAWPPARAFPITVETFKPLAKPYQPHVIPKERIEKRSELRKAVEKYFTSGGTPWLKVGWHELVAYARDGNESAALLAAGPASVPNDGRDVEAVLGRKAAEKILEKVRGQS